MDQFTLSDLLKDVPGAISDGPGPAVSGVAYRSDRVVPGDVFFCVAGERFDGHDFAADAMSRGAAALVVAHELPGLLVPQVVVRDPRQALALASARFFGSPSRSLRVVGITGTNGKTTTAYLLEGIVRSAGVTSGLIGTVETRVAGVSEPAGRTTPESRDLQEALARMVVAGVDVVAMEVSSHAIALDRTAGVDFAVTAFTNLSQDHLDFHGTMEAYLAAKTRLMLEAVGAARVVNVDDATGARLAREHRAEWTVGCSGTAMVRAEGVLLGPLSSTFTLVAPTGRTEVQLPLAGAFNVSNALVAAGCALALGMDLERVAAGLASAPQVPGRMERIDEGQPFAVLVDYAHTPDGLEKAVGAVRAVTPGRVITVFGCGGDRDTAKRPLMGEVADRLSDVVVVTSDNPRGEDPARIIGQIEEGMHPGRAELRTEIDRRRAIRLALSLARSGDAVLIAGKGHERLQQFAEGSVPFDDREVAREELGAVLGLEARAGC